MTYVRTSGDDVILQVRIRSANIEALEAGVQLGVDHLTGSAIELRLVRRDDGTHDLMVITNPLATASVPAPVDAALAYPDEELGIFDGQWHEEDWGDEES